MLKKLPKEVMPVVRILRRDVDKPLKKLSYLRKSCCPRWRIRGKPVCPMGLHPLSKSAAPSDSTQFANGRCRQKSIYRFYRWWDDLSFADAKKAVDLIWSQSATEGGIRGKR